MFVDPGFDFLSIEALARVVWKDLTTKKERDYGVGVRFLDILAENMDRLKTFLNTLINRDCSEKK